MPTLTVVIPVLDDAELLRRCLADLAAQTIPIHEIVVVDNGSTDDSAAIAHNAGARVVVEKTPGIPAAATAGLDVATGDILARIDTDTRVPRDWAQRICAAFSADPDMGALTGPGVFYDASPALAWWGEIFYMAGYFRSVRPLTGQRPLFGSNFAIRRTVWQQARADVHLGRDIHDDMDLSFVLDARARISYDKSLVVGISARPLRTTRGMVKRFYRAFVTIGANWRDRSPLRRVLERRAA